MHRYSSIAAFLAHWRALRDNPWPSAEERNQIAAMEQFFSALRPEERAAITSDASDSATARHRERAELRLRRELLACAVIDG